MTTYERAGWADWQRAEFAEQAYMASLRADSGVATDDRLGTVVAEVGGGVVWATPDDPTGGFFCRAVGQGVAEPLTPTVVDEVVRVAVDAGAPAIGLQPSPHAVTDDLLTALSERGFGPSRTWDKLYRDAAPPPTADTELRVDEVGPELAGEYASIVLHAFGMPEQCRGFVTAQLTTPGWSAYGAFDDSSGGQLVGVAAMYVDGDIAAMSGAATLTEARGRGAQRALMARRLADGIAAGVRHFGCETWSESDGNLNPSLHNMHWAGFRTLYQRTNYVRVLTG